MISLFRKIRIQALADGRTGRYLRYAVGEIILVVIGILIAVRVNTWNQERIENNRLNLQIEKLLDECVESKTLIEGMRVRMDSLKTKMTISIEIVREQDFERLDVFKENVGAIATAWNLHINTPILEEFNRQNGTVVLKNPNLKSTLNEYYEVLDFYHYGLDYNRFQYQFSIEPFISKYLNYSSTALPVYRDRLIQGGPESNFEELFQSLEFWNIMTFKLETTNGEQYILGELIEGLDTLIVELQKEIQMRHE